MIPPQQGQLVCCTQLCVSGWGTDGLWSFLEGFVTTQTASSAALWSLVSISQTSCWQIYLPGVCFLKSGVHNIEVAFLFAKLTMSPSALSPHPSPRGALGIAFHAVLAMQASPLGRRGEGPEPVDCHDINISSIVHTSCQWFNYQLTKLLAI